VYERKVCDHNFPGAVLGRELAKEATGAYARFSNSAFVVEPG